MGHDDEPVRNGEMRAVTLRHVLIGHQLAETAIANRIELIRMARSFGATWDEIGAALGMSRQTAHKRFGHVVDEHPST